MNNNGNNGAGTVDSDAAVVASVNNQAPANNRAEQNIGLAIFPFTPVSFTGPHALMAWGRVLGYGALGYMTWKNNRNISYIFISAAGISIVSSLAGKAWNGGK